jgi:hypothetical protein
MEKPEERSSERYENIDQSAEAQSESLDYAASQSIVNRKFDRYILPWLFGLWLLAFIDRSNIGNAKIVGLTQDTNTQDSTKFNVALAIFYIPYILYDVPSNIILRKLNKPR